MKKLLINFALIVFVINLSHSQEWMTNLGIAQKLALVKNKMVLMVWEETTKYPYSVLVKDDKGRTLLIENLFEDETVSPLIWNNFVPVIVSEDQYADLFLEIKDKRRQSYIDKFNDDSIKIMDVNGNILNASDFSLDLPNITKLIETYALNTEFFTPELTGFHNEPTFYSAYYLASKYFDYALYARKEIRADVVQLANIYLTEAKILLEDSPSKDKETLMQRADLLKIQENLILERPKKVIRLLKKIDATNIDNNNKGLVAFLYFTAYSCKGDEKKAEAWKSKISSVNLKKAQLIINLNS